MEAMNVKVYNQDGQEVGTVELRPEIFEIEPNQAVVHQYIVHYLARQRQGNSATKTRHDVRGGGKKPWRQKGTGRARAGSIRSPLWRGGGTVFGPSPKTYDYRLPKGMKRLAIKSIFSDKAKSDKIRIVDKLELEKIKTKSVLGIMAKLDIADRKCLVLDEGKNEHLVVSCRNLPKIKYCRAALANGYDLLDADYLVVTRAGLEKVEEVFA
jgi:large subunit ribosomal protein L4